MSRFKLLVDSDFGKPVADAVNQISSNVTATTIEACGLNSDAKDETVIAYGRRHNYILLTHDKNTINERIFPPCKHAGVIVVEQEFWFPESVVDSIKALRLSGEGNLIPHHVTHLYLDKAVVHTHSGKKEILL